jgi:site-specific DNA-cytosine methylase
MPRLRTFDLFTGIGGITHAMRGIAVPLLYCDNDPKCLEVLDRLMKRRVIPHARVVTDVSHVGSGRGFCMRVAGCLGNW